jgi:hypothetical protein
MRTNNANIDNWEKGLFAPHSLANGQIAEERVRILKSEALPTMDRILKLFHTQTDPAAKALIDSIQTTSTHNPLEFNARESEDMEGYIKRLSKLAVPVLFLTAPAAIAREAGIDPERGIIKAFEFAKAGRPIMDGKTDVDAGLAAIRGKIGNAVKEAVGKKMSYLQKSPMDMENAVKMYTGELATDALASLSKTLRSNSAAMAR